MEIYFSAPSDVNDLTKKYYCQVIEFLTNLGYQVNQAIFSETTDKIIGKDLTYEDIYNQVFEKIDKSDIFIADISYPSGGVGYQIYHAYYQKKPVIIIYTENKKTNPSVVIRGIDSKKVQTFHYDSFTKLKKALPGLINKALKKIKVRFNLVLTNNELTFLNKQARLRHISTTKMLRKIIGEYKQEFK